MNFCMRLCGTVVKEEGGWKLANRGVERRKCEEDGLRIFLKYSAQFHRANDHFRCFGWRAKN